MMTNGTQKQTPANFPTAKLSLVIYLNLRGIIPIGRTVDNGEATCLFERTADLEAAVRQVVGIINQESQQA